jgi:hypothetical protein
MNPIEELKIVKINNKNKKASSKKRLKNMKL